MNVVWIIITGFVFGILLLYSKLNLPDRLIGLALLKDFTVAKILLFVLGIGGLLLTIEILNDAGAYNFKPFYLLGTLLGGFVFGIGASLLGYSPSTLVLALGTGALDALFGILGGLIAGIIYTAFYPFFVANQGPDFGTIGLDSLFDNQINIKYILISVSVCALFSGLAFILDYIDKKRNHIKNNRWILTAFGLIVINLILFYTYSGKQMITSIRAYTYFNKEIWEDEVLYEYPIFHKQGFWDNYFLLGLFVAGICYSITCNSFRLHLIPEIWKKLKLKNVFIRIIVSLTGGFCLVLGACYAGGSSSHLLFGGMQYAVSSYVFIFSISVSITISGFLFYKLPKKIKKHKVSDD